MKFRKKPVVIEAVRWDGSDYASIQIFCGNKTTGIRNGKAVIQTLEGELGASIGDWIIKGVHGEFYPCKPDIFELTYESVED